MFVTNFCPPYVIVCYINHFIFVRLNRYSIMDENIPLNPVMELEMWCNARGHSLPKFNKMPMTSALTKVYWTSVECKWPNNGHLTRFGKFLN